MQTKEREIDGFNLKNLRNSRNDEGRRGREKRVTEKNNAEEREAQCNGNQDVVKNCTVTTAVEKAGKMEQQHF